MNCPKHWNIGKDNPMYNKKHSPETIQKMRQASLGKHNSQWKGDAVGNDSLHQWLRNHLPMPELCEDCKKVPPYDLANITGIYTRNFNNWKYLCRHCHMILDYRMGTRHH